LWLHLAIIMRTASERTIHCEKSAANRIKIDP